MVFENAESVAKAVDKLNGAEFQERHIRVDFCKEVQLRKYVIIDMKIKKICIAWHSIADTVDTSFCSCQGVSGTCNERLSIFVGNLPYDVSEEALRQLFHVSTG